MKIKIGFGFAGLFFSIYDTKSSRIKWLDFGFYFNDKMYTLVEISTTRKTRGE